MLRLRHTLSFASLFLLSLAVACGGGSHSNSGGGSGGTGPVVTKFAVTPGIAAPGQPVNFSWTTSGASAFSVTPSIQSSDSGSLPLNDTGFSYIVPSIPTTTFSATASNGSATSPPMTAQLAVIPIGLTASVMSIQAGQPVTLTYSGPNNGSTYVLTETPSNTTMNLSPSCSGSTCQGTQIINGLASTTTFTVSATLPGTQQSAYSQPVTVTVVGAVTITLTATPSNIPPGGTTPVTLSWQSMNATSVTIDQNIGNVPLDGTYMVHPSQTTTYTATASNQFGQAQASATVTVSTGGVTNLNHIIFMVQENRAFDNYFGELGTYRVNVDHIPGATLNDVNDLHNLPPGYTLKNPQGQSFPPFHAHTECIENLSPSWDESHTDMDLVGGDWLHLNSSSQYLMDKFLFTTKSGGTGDQYDPTHSRPLGYYDWTDLPFYYELASQFSTSDSWYSPVPANTIPNRLYLFAGTSYGHGYPPPPNDPVWQQPTIFRALTNAGITWRYYYQDNSIFLAQWADWNDPRIRGNVRNIPEWYNILQSPNADSLLPQVVFIERASTTGLDEHPENNVQKGAADVQQIMTALFNSTAWPDSAFILTYDEGGGVYDHQGPILVTPPDNQQPNDLGGHIQGLFDVTGFRVPVIVVSPWAKPQSVSHLPTDYMAILKLIETRFGIPPLTMRDATAGDMTVPSAGFFDFSAPHLLTVPPLPQQPTNGVCDFTKEGYQ